MLVCVSARAAESYDITLTWDAPLKRTDDSALPATEIKNYVIQYTINSTAVKTLTVAADPKTYVLTNATTGLYGFRIAVVDIYGMQSDWSEIYPAALRARPSAPVTKTITWQCKSGCTP